MLPYLVALARFLHACEEGSSCSTEMMDESSFMMNNTAAILSSSSDDQSPVRRWRSRECMATQLKRSSSCVAVLVAFAFIAYCSNRLTDYCRRRRDPNWGLPSADLQHQRDENIDNGKVAIKAGLFGLRLVGRELILEKLLESMSFLYHKDNEERDQDESLQAICATTNNEEEDDLESAEMGKYPPSVSDEHLETEKENEDEKKYNLEATGLEKSAALSEHVDGKLESTDDNHCTKTSVARDGFGSDCIANESDLLRSEVNNSEMCSICLSPYEEKDTVITVAKCSHIFHLECAKEWLLKHDHCAYCRAEMIQAKQFRQKAIVVLGKNRVEEMNKLAQANRAERRVSN